MSAPLKPAVVQLLTKLLLSSLSLVAVGPGAGRARASWIPAIRGSTVGAILAIVYASPFYRGAATMVSAAPTTVRSAALLALPAGQ